jgi:hypothetical protein
MKPRLLRPSYLFWLLGPIAAFAIYQAYGLPHPVWSYSYLGGEAGTRWYTRCVFTGPYGQFVTRPKDGRCPWFVMRKKEAAR